MKKLFLHIGLYKTGSTTLQAHLQKNRNSLRNCGYLYPLTGASDMFDAHHNLAWLLRNPKVADPNLGTWKELHEEIKTANIDNVIISSENFQLNDQTQMDNLQSQLAAYEVKVIVYLRRQDRRLESLYTQRVKRGFYHGNIFSFCESQRRRSNYYKLLEPWKQIFGLDNVIVRPLEKTQISNICDDLFKIIGIQKNNSFLEVENKNVKPGRKALEIYKIINKTYEDQPEKRQNYLQQVNRFINKNWSDEKSYRLLSYSDSVKIMEWYQQSNMKVAEEYLDRKDGTLFYEPLEYYESSKLNLQDFNQEELLGLIENIKISN